MGLPARAMLGGAELGGGLETRADLLLRARESLFKRARECEPQRREER